MDINDMKIALIISDPWDFYSKNGPGPFTANILQIKNEDILIRLIKTIKFKENVCEYFIVRSRYETNFIEELIKGETIPVNLTMINDKNAKENDPFDLSNWRGGIGLIGTINIMKD